LNEKEGKGFARSMGDDVTKPRREKNQGEKDDERRQSRTRLWAKGKSACKWKGSSGKEKKEKDQGGGETCGIAKRGTKGVLLNARREGEREEGKGGKAE